MVASTHWLASGAGMAVLERGGNALVPGTGLLAATVPGSFDAWMLLLRDFGTLRLADVAEYAIGYAEEGHPVLPRVAGSIAGMEDLFRNDWTTSAETYLPAPE